MLGKGMRIKTILASYVTGGAILSEVIIFRQEHRESSYNLICNARLATTMDIKTHPHYTLRLLCYTAKKDKTNHR